jgi:hypothetical protein
MKKFNAILLVLLTSLFFIPTSFAGNAVTKTSGAYMGEIWHVRWTSNNPPSIPGTALWVKRNDQNEYYALWSAGTSGVTGDLIINQTQFSFDGRGNLSNGDMCSFNGSIQSGTFTGSYFCRNGDSGRVNGTITIG